MSLYDRDLSLSLLALSSVDTAPDHMLYPRDFTFYTYINLDPEDMLMIYLVKIGWIVKMATIFIVFFIFVILPIDFNLENRFFVNVFVNVRPIFQSNI